MARRFATRIGSIRANRFAEEKPIFITCKRFARIASDLRFAIFSPPKRDSQKKKEVQFGNPETIRENRVIRANLRIDSRESGHRSPSERVPQNHRQGFIEPLASNPSPFKPFPIPGGYGQLQQNYRKKYFQAKTLIFFTCPRKTPKGKDFFGLPNP